MNAERLLEVYEQISEAPDAIARLRTFVLNLAVRGKVGTSVPEESPVENYQSNPEWEWLPKNWRALNFGSHCDIQGGNQPPKSQFSSEPRDGYVRLFQIRDLGSKPVPVYIPKNSTKRFCKEGEILIGRYGASVGKIFWAQTGAYNVALAKFIWPEDALTPEFCFLLLKSNLFQAHLEGASRSAQAGFNKGDLAAVNFPVPPLAERHRIVAKVDELMALCDRLEEARKTREETRDKLTAASLARLTAPDIEPEDFPAHAAFALEALPALTTRPDQIKTLRQTILNLAVRGKLVEQNPADEPASELLERLSVERDRLLQNGEIKKQKPILPVDDSDIPYEAPQSWKWARFNEVAAIQSNLVAPKGYPDMPHIAPDNIEGWTARLRPYVTVKEAGVFSGKHLFAAGSILYSKIRPNLAKVTVANFDGLCSADMYPVRAHISRDFLVKFMITKSFVDQSVSEDNRVAMPKINQAALSNILIPVPPLAEQCRIVAKVDALMALCDRLEAALSATDTTRTRLLEALLHEALEPATEVLEAAE